MNLTGRFRILGVGVTPQVFIDLASARNVLQIETSEQITSERYFFNINARTKTSNGYIGEFCNITQNTAPVADYYAAFNYMTEQYEDYATYAEATSKITQLRAVRCASLTSVATIEAEWLDDASGTLSWIIYETLNDPKA